MVAAAAQTVVLPRPKPDVSAAVPGGTSTAPADLGPSSTPAPVPPTEAAVGPASLDDVLQLSDQEIIDRYGLGANLSRNAELIVATTAATSDINTACRSRQSLRAAMEPAVKGLADKGKIQGKLWPIAFEAGKYMWTNCGKL
jgi:hypothetical protein